MRLAKSAMLEQLKDRRRYICRLEQRVREAEAVRNPGERREPRVGQFSVMNGYKCVAHVVHYYLGFAVLWCKCYPEVLVTHWET